MVKNTIKRGKYYLTDWTPYANLLYKKGIITEGYNPNRDVYERVYNLGGLMLTRDLHTFSGAAGKTRILAKQRESIEVSRPGVSMTFDSMAELSRRMWKLAEHPGFNEAPFAPWIIHNKATGVYKFLPTQLPVNAWIMRHGVHVPSIAA